LQARLRRENSPPPIVRRSDTTVGGLWGAGSFLFASEPEADTIFQVDIPQKLSRTVAGVPNPYVAATVPSASALDGVDGIWSDGRYMYAADWLANVIRKIDLQSGQSTILVQDIRAPIGVWG